MEIGTLIELSSLNGCWQNFRKSLRFISHRTFANQLIHSDKVLGILMPSICDRHTRKEGQGELPVSLVGKNAKVHTWKLEVGDFQEVQNHAYSIQLHCCHAFLQQQKDKWQEGHEPGHLPAHRMMPRWRLTADVSEGQLNRC